METDQKQPAENALAQDFHFLSLIRFAFPTMVMMIFMGLYTIVDTIFVSRFVNTNALSALNIVCPVINLTVGLGTMLAAGGSAIVAAKMGQGREQEARRDLRDIHAVWRTLPSDILPAGNRSLCDRRRGHPHFPGGVSVLRDEYFYFLHVYRIVQREGVCADLIFKNLRSDYPVSDAPAEIPWDHRSLDGGACRGSGDLDRGCGDGIQA